MAYVISFVDTRKNKIQYIKDYSAVCQSYQWSLTEDKTEADQFEVRASADSIAETAISLFDATEMDWLVDVQVEKV